MLTPCLLPGWTCGRCHQGARLASILALRDICAGGGTLGGRPPGGPPQWADVHGLRRGPDGPHRLGFDTVCTEAGELGSHMGPCDPTWREHEFYFGVWVQVFALLVARWPTVCVDLHYLFGGVNLGNGRKLESLALRNMAWSFDSPRVDYPRSCPQHFLRGPCQIQVVLCRLGDKANPFSCFLKPHHSLQSLWSWLRQECVFQVEMECWRTLRILIDWVDKKYRQDFHQLPVISVAGQPYISWDSVTVYGNKTTSTVFLPFFKNCSEAENLQKFLGLMHLIRFFNFIKF